MYFFTVHGAPIHQPGICQITTSAHREVLHFGLHVVIAVRAHDLNIMSGVAQETIRDLGQGVIQLAFRVRKFFRRR